VQALEAFLVERMRARAGHIVDRPTPANKRIRRGPKRSKLAARKA
jgi:hypothetical protein